MPAGSDAEWKRNKLNNAVLTTTPLDKPGQNYPIGDFTEPKEQSEADSHSLVSVPNRIRSDRENDYHNK